MPTRKLYVVLLLSGTLFIAVSCVRPTNRSIATINRLRIARAALLEYRNDQGTWPTGATSQIFLQLAGCVGGLDDGTSPVYLNEAYLDGNGDLVDGWGTPIRVIIREAEKRVIVVSLGPNCRDDRMGGDDLWEIGVADSAGTVGDAQTGIVE